MNKQQIDKLATRMKLIKAGGLQSVMVAELLNTFNQKMGVIKGDKGEDGKTPQKGVDYFTNAEINQIAENVIKAIEANIKPAKDGYIPVAGKDYPSEAQINQIVETEVNKAVVQIKIRMPKDGQEGKPGEDGKTPQKGVDYFTKNDIEAMVNEVLAKVPRIIEKRSLPSISLLSRGNGRAFEVVDNNGVNLGQAVRKIQLGSGLTGTIVGDGVLKIVSSGGSGISGTANFNETPSGSINDSNSVFTLAHTPDQTQFPLSLFLNGVRQRAGGIDFTLSGATITFVTPPASGSTLWADYYF